MYLELHGTINWASACVVSLYKGIWDNCDCTSFRGASPLSIVGKVYGSVNKENWKGHCGSDLR